MFDALYPPKRHLGFDDERSWIAVAEVDEFLCPGYDLRKIGRTERYDYGFLPPRFFNQVLDASIRIAAQFAQGYIERMTAAIDPKRIRERVGLSQAKFAARYRLSRDTVRGWEAGRPLSGSARILLTLIDRAPDQIAEILAEEVPNAETVAAMKAARRGEGTDFATLDDLFADLNAPDH